MNTDVPGKLTPCQLQGNGGFTDAKLMSILKLARLVDSCQAIKHPPHPGGR